MAIEGAVIIIICVPPNGIAKQNAVFRIFNGNGFFRRTMMLWPILASHHILSQRNENNDANNDKILYLCIFETLFRHARWNGMR